MKRSLFHTLGCAVLALGFSAAAPVWAQAQTIVYPSLGTSLQSGILSGGTPWDDVLTTGVTTVNGRHKSTSVTGNTVTLNSGGTPEPWWVGGAINFGDTEGLSSNRVIITGGSTEYAKGAYHYLPNGNTSVTNNLLEVSGGALSQTTGGGDAESHDGDALASNNTVIITGGTVNREVYGGRAYSESGQADASNNTVRIGPGLPGTVFGSNVWLLGGYARTNTGATVSTGNTLQIESAGLSVEALGYFQRFEFTLPAGLANSDTVLISTAWTDIGTNAVMTVSAVPGFTVSPGDAFILIDGTGSSLNGTVAAASQSGTIGGHHYSLAVESDTVVLRILQPVQSRATTTSVPVAGGGVLAALGLLLAGLAAAGLRRRRC